MLTTWWEKATPFQHGLLMMSELLTGKGNIIEMPVSTTAHCFLQQALLQPTAILIRNQHAN